MPPPSTPPPDIGTAGVAAIAAGLPANGIMLWSCYTLFSTGAGLPPGPAGLLGAAEVGAARRSCSGGGNMRSSVLRSASVPAGHLAALAAACGATLAHNTTQTRAHTQGISYLVVLGLIGWSIATKVKTGR